MTTNVLTRHKQNCGANSSKGICFVPIKRTLKNDEMFWNNCVNDGDGVWKNDETLNRYCRDDFGPSAMPVKIGNEIYREKRECGTRNSKGLCKIAVKELIPGEEELWTNAINNKDGVWRNEELKRKYCRSDLGPDSDITIGQFANPVMDSDGRPTGDSIGICKINPLNRTFKAPAFIQNAYVAPGANPQHDLKDLNTCSNGNCPEGYYLWKNDVSNTDGVWGDNNKLNQWCVDDFGQGAVYKGSFLIRKAQGQNPGTSRGVCYVPGAPTLNPVKQSYWINCVNDNDGAWNDAERLNDWCYDDFGYGLDDNGNLVKSRFTTISDFPQQPESTLQLKL